MQSLSYYFYQQRQNISLLCFGNQHYQWLINAKKAEANIDSVLVSIKAGGGTPLRAALLEICRYIDKRKQLKPMEKQKLFLITDGRSQDSVASIVLKDVEIVVLDSENTNIRLNKAQNLANTLQASYSRLF